MDLRIEDDVVISENIKIPSDTTVTAVEGVSVQIVDGAELIMEENASLTVNGSLIHNGALSGDGTFQLNGSLSGMGTFGGTIQLFAALTETMIANVPEKIYDGTFF